MDPKIKREKRIQRHKRIRAKIKGTVKVPRLCVFRSKNHIYAQLIDDEKGKTLVVASDLEIKDKKQRIKIKKQKDTKEDLKRKVKIAYQVGKLITEKALKKKIKKVVFDRGGFAFHGRVKALAKGAREGGLLF